MAILTIPDKNLSLRGEDEIKKHLAAIGIDYERWDARDVSPDAAPEEILAAYSEDIKRLKAENGYQTADVIDIKPTTENLDAMLDKFKKEHWHDEDEVRFIIKGCGIFHIAPKDSEVVSITMEAGDLIRVPRGTFHWFGLSEEKTVRAIRLFQNVSGWAPFYTESGAETKYSN
jgi:1,2-dihydroxy-3-keto-5-methylthiopentene dioxygenase